MVYQPREYIHWTSDLTSTNPRGVSRRSAVISGAEYSETPLDSLTLSLKIKGSGLETKVSLTVIDQLPIVSEDQLREESKIIVANFLKDFDVTSYKELVGKDVTAMVYEDERVIGVKRDY